MLPNQLMGGLLSRHFGFVASFYLLYENFSRLKAGDKMFIDYHGGILRDVPGNLLCSFLIDEAAEAPHIDVFSFGQ